MPQDFSENLRREWLNTRFLCEIQREVEKEPVSLSCFNQPFTTLTKCDMFVGNREF